MKTGPFKNELKPFREAVPITQTELSKRLIKRGFKATPAYISQIEAGLKHIPFGLAIAICEELGMEPNRVTEIFLPKYFTVSEDCASKVG